MKRFGVVVACVLVYALLSIATAAVLFRTGFVHDCWEVSRHPAETSGMVIGRWCNHRGNCRATFEYQAGGKTLRNIEWDTEHSFRVGVPVKVTYDAEFPEISVAGSLEDRFALERYSLVLATLAVTPLVALILLAIGLYFFLAARNDSRRRPDKA